VELPAGSIVTVTIDMPETEVAAAKGTALPVRDMGAIRGTLSRAEIYGDADR
jgi:hypothetical protein